MKRIFIEDESPQIEVKHEGILEVPEGKNVDDLPMSHFEKLAKKKGLGKITKALNNLQVWNKEKNPELSKWADNMIDKLNNKLKKDETIKRRNKIGESFAGWTERCISVDDDYQEGAVEEILVDAKQRDDRITWDIDYDGGIFGGKTVFHIWSDEDTYALCRHKIQELRDDALYEKGYYESISKNRRTSLNEDVYDVYYDYDYQYGDGEDDWATDTAHETFTGSWGDLQDFIRELKASGYYNIDATARDDVAESCDECCSESLDEGLGMDSIDLGKELYKTAVSTLKSSAHNLSIEDIQNAFDYAMMKVEDKFAKNGI